MAPFFRNGGSENPDRWLNVPRNNQYVEEFRRNSGHICDYVSDYPTMENVHLAEGYDAVSTIVNVITDEMYEAWAAMGIKYMACRSVGYDHMNLPKMKELGYQAVHATYSPNAVANYTIMLMLMSCRKMPFIMQKAQCQDFSLPGKIGKELSLCTVGIIGTGQIGETLIRHLSGFGCRILAYSTTEKESVKQYAEYVDLDTLYRECDVISIHVPGLPKNYHMIDREAISKMKDDVIFINTARGMVVDSEALIEGLESGKIGYAAIDTFEEEFGLYYKNLEREQIANRTRAILSTFQNVILTPHMAFYTEQSTSDMVRTTMKGLIALETGEDNPVKIEI